MTGITPPRLEVCFSPALLHLYDTRDTIVVIIDVFRATSTIAAALDNGARRVLPVASVEECIALGDATANSITAGERDGKIASGLQHGNSPLEYPASFVAGKTLVLTTTNGTRLLHMVRESHAIVTGSFLNLSATCDYLSRGQKPVLLACAAWKDRFNLEDALLAGVIISRIGAQFSINCDSARTAKYLAAQSGTDYIGFLKDSAHYRRLAAFGLERDMEYCAMPDLHPVVPILSGKELVKAGE